MNAAAAARARFVLKDTTHPGNIGAAARAIHVMGFSRLVLAAPKTLMDSQTRAFAAGGAAAVLEKTLTRPGLPSAVSECALVVGFSARPRELSPKQDGVRGAAKAAAEILAAGGEAAFVFGGERSGLNNEDMRRCGIAARIPSARGGSLNLAQAVQIAAYELRLALRGEDAKPARREMPTQEQLEMLFAHFGEFLDDINMPKRGDGGLLSARVRRLITRAQPDAPEVRMLRGILRAARKKTAAKARAE